MEWKIIDSGRLQAEDNMHIDAELLTQLHPDDAPILHLYAWKQPSLTYGYFIQLERWLHLPSLQRWNIDVARRPTGGGITFHLSDFAFSILIPARHALFSSNTLENYHTINQMIQKILQPLFPPSKEVSLSPLSVEPRHIAAQQFCSAHPTQYDLILHGKKIGGAAQRKTKSGFLHQGSIFLSPLPRDVLQSILLDAAVLPWIEESSMYLGQEMSSLNLQQMQALCYTLFRQKIPSHSP